jgi:hypothetical protein
MASEAETAKLVSHAAVSTTGTELYIQGRCRLESFRDRLYGKTKNYFAADLDRCASVAQNFRDQRGKVIYSAARHDNAVAASMSLLGDAQEFSTLIFAELNVEMLPFDLQLFRLDDVIHLFLRAPTLPYTGCGMEEKSAAYRPWLGQGTLQSL